MAAPVFFICQATFTAQVHVQTLGATHAHSRHPSPIVIDRLDLNKAYTIEAQTVKSVESSPSISVASASSSGPSSARSPLNTHSPLASKRLETDAIAVQALPEATTSATTNAQVTSSTSLLQSVAAATLMLTSPTTTSDQTTAQAETEAKTERAPDKADASTLTAISGHMSFGDPEYDSSIAAIPLTTDTYTLPATHIPDAAEPKAATPARTLTECQNFDIPDNLQKGMIGHNTARKDLIRRSQSSPDGFPRTLSKDS